MGLEPPHPNPLGGFAALSGIFRQSRNTSILRPEALMGFGKAREERALPLPILRSAPLSRCGALEKIRHQSIEPVGLVPMYPVRAVVEDMEFCVRQGFQ